MVIEVYGGFYAIALNSLKSSYNIYIWNQCQHTFASKTCAVILQCITCYYVGDSHHVTSTSNSQQQFHPDIKRCVQTYPIMIISACTLKLPNQKVEQ